MQVVLVSDDRSDAQRRHDAKMETLWLLCAAALLVGLGFGVTALLWVALGLFIAAVVFY